MEYGNITGVKQPVPRILLGTAVKPMLLGQDADEMLDAAVENGINAFDTARNYGGAEASLGRWLKKRGVRGEVVLLSKCAHPDERGSRVNERAIREDFARSQEALGTDYIDIYLLHRDDERVPVGEIVELLNAMHREGKIGAFGGSNWTHERLAAANEYARSRGLIPFAASSPNFGLAHQMCDPWGGGCVTISGAENGAAREWYRKTQLPVIAYSSLGRGFFSGKFRSGERARARKVLDAVARKAYDCEENYLRLRRAEELAGKKGCTVSEIAMRWAFSEGLNVFAVVSALSRERILGNIAALSLPMTAKEAEYLDLRREDHE